MNRRTPLWWRVLIVLVNRLPQVALSRVVGRLADLKLPRFLRRPVLAGFALLVGIDRSEVELDLPEYPSLGAFFVRRLRPGARPMADDQHAIVSPVDGRLAEFGVIESGRLIQAKGLAYEVADLLDDPGGGDRFEGGVFITIYLSPKDYHRIHAPCAGSVVRARHVPGRLFPVNRPAVALVPNLFVRNERVVCHLEGACGQAAVVAVGALNVGRISCCFDPPWNGTGGGVTNRSGKAAETRVYAPPVPCARGDEIMAFHLGSTVVMLFEAGHVSLLSDLESGRFVRLGEVLATAL